MKLSEKLFLWISSMTTLILALIFVLSILHRQGFPDYMAEFGAAAGDLWQDVVSQWQGAGKENKAGGSEVVWQTETSSEKSDISQEGTGSAPSGETVAEQKPGGPDGQPGAEDGENATRGVQPVKETEENPPAETGKRPESESGTVPAAVLEIQEQESSTEEDQYPYYIKVNKKQNCVTIYERDESGEYTVPVRAMICSTGYATPKGVFGSKGKYVMKGLIHGVFGQYSTWITGNILFHSVPSARATKDSVSVRNYNQLGTTASAGCVRLTVADAKWIYDNCEIGTLIEIYEGDDPGPLGKPESIKLPEGSRWDPTDPDPKNPWHEHEPSITVEEEYFLYYGQEWTPLADITALDTCGNDITQKVEISGEVDCYRPGRYRVGFRVTDAVGKSAATECDYIVMPVIMPEEEAGQESNEDER